jgi:hypothetical protein
MNPILALALALSLLPLTADPPASPWGDIRLTIFRDPYTSSDQVTICRVRADNLGGRSWSGRALAFEARALGGDAHERARGRFGLVLAPYGSLETLIALPGRHDRLEVVPIEPKGSSEEREQKVRRKPSRRRPKRPA